MFLSPFFDVSQRQDPVLHCLADLLDHSKAVSAAIADNSQDEQLSIPSTVLTSFYKDLDIIKANLMQAHQAHERSQN